MDRLQVFLVVVLGLTCYCHGRISGSQLEVTVRPGENITIYCDCKRSAGEYTVWFRNCSHENQPPLVLSINSVLRDGLDDHFQKIIHHYELVQNRSSQSFDLMILNITDSDEGVYYCGTEELQVLKNNVTSTSDYRYGKVTTRIILNSSEPQRHQQDQPGQNCGQCWMLLVSLCPVSALLSSLGCSVVVCLIYRKTAKDSQADHQESGTGGQTDLNKAEDVCYAALEIHQPSQRPRKKKIKRSDLTIYSAIKTTEI